MPNAIFQLDESQVLSDHEARLRRLESTSYAVGLGSSYQLLGRSTGAQGTAGISTSWATLGTSGNLSFTIPALSQQVNTRNILVLGHITFGAWGTIDSFGCLVQLGIASTYGGAYVSPNSGFNPSDICGQHSTNMLTANSTFCSATPWAVMNLNAGSYNAYYQYEFDSGVNSQILVAGTPSIAVFAFG